MSQPDEKNICPVCQYENPPGAKQCEKCKAPLGIISTIPVPDDVPIETSKTRDISGYKGELRAGALALHVAGQPQPIIVKGQQDEIVLGRYVLNDQPPTVDLSEYHAHLLGVSRRHAVIRKKDNQYTLEDLNSSNGTWRNENRLPPNEPQPLQHGDQIRLGQLIMFVYFTSIQSIKLVEQSEQTAALARRRITPRYMTAQVGPYLVAIEELQAVMDALLGRPAAEVGLGSLVVEAENSFSVTLENAVEAVHWLRTKITPWRKQHAEVIGRLRGTEPAKPAENAQTSGTAEPEPAKPAENAQTPAPPPDRQQFESHLAKELIAQVAPLLAPEAIHTHIPKLLPPLHTLLFSTIEISDEP